MNRRAIEREIDRLQEVKRQVDEASRSARPDLDETQRHELDVENMVTYVTADIRLQQLLDVWSGSTGEDTDYDGASVARYAPLLRERRHAMQEADDMETFANVIEKFAEVNATSLVALRNWEPACPAWEN